VLPLPAWGHRPPSGQFSESVRIHAFVVGHGIAAKTALRKTVEDFGTIRATTYGTLVDTASRRLFGLKQRLDERYGELKREAMPPSLLKALGNYQLELPKLEAASSLAASA
jgi:hypothetical protein